MKLKGWSCLMLLQKCTFFTFTLITAVAFGADPLQATDLAADHRSGQTFITWTERSDETDEHYRIYRHDQPIDSSNLAETDLLYEVPEDSSRFYADRYKQKPGSGAWLSRYVNRFVIVNQGSELTTGTGLLVWTLADSDFGGGSSGDGYYAVTTVNSVGTENTTDFTAANTTGPVAEQINDPMPVEITYGTAREHVYIQYMDLRRWNVTFHAPNSTNDYYDFNPADTSVADAIQYAYTYYVLEPNPAAAPDPLPPRAPVILNLHFWWGDNRYGPGWQDGMTAFINDHYIFQIRPTDTTETWWYGFARNHDYRQGSVVGDGDTVVNYTEHRLLRMIYDLQRDSILGSGVDPNRVYVLGHSMGGSGALSLAMRYPNVFACAYANVGMTNYRTSGDAGGFDFRPDVSIKWGTPNQNLPNNNIGPSDWANHLQVHDGTGIWDWQNHQANMQNGIAEDRVPLGMDHGINDTFWMEWLTQGQPAYGAFNAGRPAWGGRVLNGGHNWNNFLGMPPSLAPDTNSIPFAGYQVVRDETVPGLSNGSADQSIPPNSPGGYNQTIEWSSSWDPWDGVPTDTISQWGISLRTTDATDQTVDVTPRRLQNFSVVAEADYYWENRLVSDDSLVTSDVLTADTNALITVPGFTVSATGNRLRIYTAVADIMVSPLVLMFDDQHIGSELPQTLYVSITNTGTLPLSFREEGLRIIGTEEFFLSEIPDTNSPILPGSDVDVGVTFDAMGAYGSRVAVLQIISDDPDEEIVEVELRALAVPVELSDFTLE